MPQPGSSPEHRRVRPGAALLAALISLAAAGVPVAAPTPTASPAIHATAQATPAAAASASPGRATPQSGSNPFGAFKFSASNGPVQIHADTLKLNYKTRSVDFQGHVRASQSGTTLNSQRLRVIYGDKFNDIQRIIATGDVRMVQGGRWATGQKAVLDEVHHTVEMTGNPVIHDGPNQVAGQRIIIYLDSEKSVVEGASAVIFPSQGSSRVERH